MALEAAFAHHRPLPRLDSARGNSGIRTGTVVAELHSAANLPAADLNGFSDPFCSLKASELMLSTSITCPYPPMQTALNTGLCASPSRLEASGTCLRQFHPL